MDIDTAERLNCDHFAYNEPCNLILERMAMQVMTAKDAKTRFGEALDTMQREPILITKNNRPVGMMVSIADLEGTYLADQFMEQEAGYDDWVNTKVGASLARLRNDGSQGKPFEEVHAGMMEKVRLRLKNK